jgi:hypothetical protein
VSKIPNVVETVLEGHGVKSLLWDGDELVDWAVGGDRYRLDGTMDHRPFFLAYDFDRAILSRCGRYCVVYAEYGTKGLVFRDKKLIREINRSYYFAHAYPYPVALLTLGDGRVIVAHCPEAYNRLEFEDVENGVRLTVGERAPADIFHSRLTVSPDGCYLVSAGWYWHPIDTVVVFDIARALIDPAHLDSDGICASVYADACSTTFTAKGDLLVGCAGDIDCDDDFFRISRFRLPLKEALEAIDLDSVPGDLMTVGENFAFRLYDIPRLIDLRTGECLRSWPGVALNQRMGSTARRVTEGRVIVAPDTANRRFAIANGTSIRVFQVESD